MKMTKSKFAILYAQESMFWQLCSDNDWPTGLTERYKAFCRKVEKAKASFGNSMNRTFSGFESNEDISHYDIDKALKAAFKSKVRVDSESGNFFAYSNAKNEAAISTWLKKNYPTLNFKVYEDKDDMVQNPYFCNWNEAEAFCKKKGLKVTMPKEAKVDDDTINQLESIENEIAELLSKKESLKETL